MCQNFPRPKGQDAARFLNQLDSPLSAVRMAQKSSRFKKGVAGQNVCARLVLLNDPNVSSLFDDADSFFHTNSEFLEFDALLESADSTNEEHSSGQLALVRASPHFCMHERNACSVCSRGPAPLLRGDYSGEERRDLRGLPCSCLAASYALTLSVFL